METDSDVYSGITKQKAGEIDKVHSNLSAKLDQALQGVRKLRKKAYGSGVAFEDFNAFPGQSIHGQIDTRRGNFNVKFEGELTFSDMNKAVAFIKSIDASLR